MDVMKELAEWKEKLQARETELIAEIETCQTELKQVKRALGRKPRSQAYVSIGSKGLTAWILNALEYEPMTALEIRDGFFGDRILTKEARRAGLNSVNTRLHFMIEHGRVIANSKPDGRRGRIFSKGVPANSPIPTTWKPQDNTTTRSNKPSLS